MEYHFRQVTYRLFVIILGSFWYFNQEYLKIQKKRVFKNTKENGATFEGDHILLQKYLSK